MAAFAGNVTIYRQEKNQKKVQTICKQMWRMGDCYPTGNNYYEFCLNV